MKPSFLASPYSIPEPLPPTSKKIEIKDTVLSSVSGHKSRANLYEVPHPLRIHTSPVFCQYHNLSEIFSNEVTQHFILRTSQSLVALFL